MNEEIEYPRLVIEEVDNGFIVTSGEGTINVFQEQEDGEVDTMVELLCFVKNAFGLHHDKFGSKNIYINIFPGSKSCERPDECPLCYSKIKDSEE
jgi:hypothetical protein